nr:MAG TPA: endopeptidase [Caudoviricetes sp.]
MMEEISGSLKGRFVDDDDIVRTGRAMIEINGWDFLHVPIPVGLSGKLKSFESAMDSRLVKSRKDAEAAASSAGEAADSAEEARGSASAAEASAGRASGSESAAAESESAAQDHASTAEGHATAAGEQVSLARGQAEAAAASADTAREQATTAEGHASRAQQSAEESGRAADRAEGARGEARAAWDGAKEARDAAQGHASTAEGHANAAASSAGDAEGAAGRADTSAQQVREIAESTSWDGDQVTINGKQSPHLTGPPGEPGPPGPPGTVDGIDFEQYAKVEQLSDVVREGSTAYLTEVFLDVGEETKPGVAFQHRGAEAYVVLNADNRLVLTNFTEDADRVVSMPDQWDFNTHVDMRGNQLRGLPAPSGDNHAATKSYVDGKAEGKQDKAKVLDRLAQYTEDGGTITPTVGASGAFVFPKCVVVTDNDGWVKAAGEPEDDWHVANKQYVDSQVSAVRDRVGALESGGGGGGFWAGTQAAYNRESKDSNTLYVITG